MKNLLNETRNIIKECGQSIKEIAYIGNNKGERLSWKQFTDLADFDYEHEGGNNEIVVRLDLTIIFENGDWLERRASHGMEWWRYNATMKIPSHGGKMENLSQPHFLQKQRS